MPIDAAELAGVSPGIGRPGSASGLADLEYRAVVGQRVDATSYDDAMARVLAWAREGVARYVCVSTVHMIMEGHDNPEFRAIVNGADLVTPDGMPLVWSLGAFGVAGATRVYGPELTPLLCEAAAREGVPVGFYGGTPEVMAALETELLRRYPSLEIAYRYCPPFRPPTEEEDATVVRDIEASGARIVFVGIGCPKQERWMEAHKDRLPVVMVGVGAAFDFVAGVKSQAPAWMQRAGLEWAFRVATEPGRLWKRYATTVPRFLWLVSRQLAASLFADRKPV